MNEIDKLVGETITSIEGANKWSERIVFNTKSGRQFVMMHRQNCCEDVSLDSISGNIQDIIGSKVLAAGQKFSSEDPYRSGEHKPESYTWSYFYIDCGKGVVSFRWYGTSNGYYSETAEFEEITAEK